VLKFCTRTSSSVPELPVRSAVSKSYTDIYEKNLTRKISIAGSTTKRRTWQGVQYWNCTLRVINPQPRVAALCVPSPATIRSTKKLRRTSPIIAVPGYKRYADRKELMYNSLYHPGARHTPTRLNLSACAIHDRR
jgi:hypothetical protein